MDQNKEDKPNNELPETSRRGFLKAASAASLTTGIGRAAQPTGLQTEKGGQSGSNEKVIAIQVPAVSFSDEGVDGVLDTVQQRAGVNTLLIAAFSYGRGIEGRQIPGHPLPDHGKQQYDTNTFHGGDYAAIHPEYYQGVIYKNFRAPELGDFDVLGSVVPAAKKRGMKSYCWFEDVYNPRLLDNFEKTA
ncbi:MAG: twin-arginine translocation signal domain-containing protein, partial [Bryobacteraceae bacterium]